MKVVALILAAGEAKRFGYPKQILKWKKSTILGSVITEAVNADFSEVYVVLGAHFDKITASLKKELSLVKLVYNCNWKEGMYSSIKAGITYAVEDSNPDYILFQLGDMPFITKDVFNKFIEMAKKAPDVVIAEESNRPAHPYMFHKKFLEEILSSEPADGMRSFIKREFKNAYKIPVDRNIAREDIDTWEKYAQLHSNNLHLKQ